MSYKQKIYLSDGRVITQIIDDEIENDELLKHLKKYGYKENFTVYNSINGKSTLIININLYYVLNVEIEII